ncbi:hypothetical Protein YC6258_00235 [Gynuella sunshinyii YC6258]|uniref:Uncharacterized protein n=1 Tax=Gynuella sunshinyii YC6258 TaxID=1445510 RepID=A0A0C5VCT5_9GAMM|nr:hypothetical Protein YC6258_00235 [Gynuella sunshinyii YC6258]
MKLDIWQFQPINCSFLMSQVNLLDQPHKQLLLTQIAQTM